MIYPIIYLSTFWLLLLSMDNLYLIKTSQRLVRLDTRVAQLSLRRKNLLNDLTNTNLKLKSIHQYILVLLALTSIQPSVTYLISELKFTAYAFYKIMLIRLEKFKIQEQGEVLISRAETIYNPSTPILSPKISLIKSCKENYELTTIPKGFCNLNLFSENNILLKLKGNTWCRSAKVILSNKNYINLLIAGETCDHFESTSTFFNTIDSNINSQFKQRENK